MTLLVGSIYAIVRPFMPEARVKENKMPTDQDIRQYVIGNHKNDSTQELNFILQGSINSLPACKEEHKQVLTVWIETIKELLATKQSTG
ncbi:MAG TPA: hypothetical protein VE957_14155 [Terriglobales bacterium]|nr:hypothetical protein [Terriglobales bacterium]